MNENKPPLKIQRHRIAQVRMLQRLGRDFLTFAQTTRTNVLPCGLIKAFRWIRNTSTSSIILPVYFILFSSVPLSATCRARNKLKHAICIQEIFFFSFILDMLSGYLSQWCHTSSASSTLLCHSGDGSYPTGAYLFVAAIEWRWAVVFHQNNLSDEENLEVGQNFGYGNMK